MTIETENGGKLKEVYSIESYGGSGNKVLMKIFVDLGRELTETDKNNISNAAYDLERQLKSENVRLDPKTTERVKEDKKNIIDLFKGQEIFVQEVPNEYGGVNDAYYKHFPWYRITTKIGHFKIGWRKSVMSIHWDETLVNTKAKILFPDETVTMGDNYIHAGSYEAAQEFIDKIMSEQYERAV